MREIEFRGKKGNSKEWLYGDLSYGGTENNHKKFASINIWEDGLKTGYVVKQETIGQYTGLKDKNGQKIFEGDIVSYTAIVTEYEENTRPYSYKDIFEGEVIYDYGSFWINDRQLYQIAAYDDEFEPEIEVIGNIYDNPELLKEEI